VLNALRIRVLLGACSRDHHHIPHPVFTLSNRDRAGNWQVTVVEFIERWFGIAPDGGDGSIEIMFVVMFIWIIAVAWRLKRD